MMRLWGAVIALSYAAMACAHAESAKDVLKEFGLLGAWSPDCVAADHSRLTYSVSFFGSLQFTSSSKYSKGSLSGEIREAAILKPEELRYVYKVTDAPASPYPGAAVAGDVFEAVIDKFADKCGGDECQPDPHGSKIRIMETKQVDGPKQSIHEGFIYKASEGKNAEQWNKTAQKTAVLEKCAN